MKGSRKYLIAPLIIIMILTGLLWTANMWIWLVITIISAILPGATNRLGQWGFIHYFISAIVAMLIFLLVSPPETEVVRAMGQLVPVGETGYVALVIGVSAIVYAQLSLTFRSLYRRFGNKNA